VVLRTESADTHYQAFKDVVEIVTLLPGLHALLLHAKYTESPTSTEDISFLWSRANVPPDDKWKFWKKSGCNLLGQNHDLDTRGQYHPIAHIL
jgi:hypothetical protein